ncbi:MAG: hypothetical protein HWN79_19470, partial [Candidatus Lokiarchaeota archaeon]|nr:hypothetical protein [Candidatus Lokiarchaeota archaeon]
MYKHSLKKKNKLIFLILITLGITAISSSLPFFTSNLISNTNENFDMDNDDIQNITPKTSEYQNFDGSGELLNVTLHQSLTNTTLKQFSN